MTVYNDEYLRSLTIKPDGPGPYDPLPGKLAQMLLLQREVARDIEKKLDAANLQKDEAMKALDRSIVFNGQLLQEKKDAERLYDECLKIAERNESYSPYPNPSDFDLGWKRCARAIAVGIREAVKISDDAAKKRIGEVVNEPPRQVCWFAEVDPQSKAACSACKDLTWPTPGWIHSDGSYLTSDPHKAKRFSTKDRALDFCCLAHVRHWHLNPTEHMFVGM